MTLRRSTYRLGAVLGDVNAVTKAARGKPKGLIRRIVNKWIGRNLVSRMWR